MYNSGLPALFDEKSENPKLIKNLLIYPLNWYNIRMSKLMQC